MSKERSLDIFDLLAQIDRKNYDLWDKLSEDQRKEFSPLVVMRWMAGMSDPVQLIFLNEIINTSVFPLGTQKEFLLKLLTVCSNGKTKRYSWTNYKLSGEKKAKLSVKLIAERYGMSIKDAEDARRLFNVDDLLELAEEQGLQKEEIAALKKELK
jgi:hypothetical protein